MFSFFSRAPKMPSAAEALPGRAAPSFTFEDHHAVLGRPLTLAAAPGAELVVGLGCFWGAERRFWTQPGVLTTAVGYAAGLTPNPTYKEVCSGLTGHNEVVRVVFDPTVTSLAELLRVFWESHDPTQGFRQGNDVGTQYRSGVYLADPSQRAEAEAGRHSYQRALAQAGLGVITTEILELPAFYYAEDYHQQYLHKNPGGYCGLGGTGVGCPIGLAAGGALR